MFTLIRYLCRKTDETALSYDFETRDMAIILKILIKTDMFENMKTLKYKKVLNYTCAKMPVGFTNVAGTKACTSKFTK